MNIYCKILTFTLSSSLLSKDFKCYLLAFNTFCRQNSSFYSFEGHSTNKCTFVTLFFKLKYMSVSYYPFRNSACLYTFGRQHLFEGMKYFSVFLFVLKLFETFVNIDEHV